MSQLHSGSLQGMLFSTPFLFNICSKLLHLESISRAWVSKAYSKPQTRLARRKSLCPPPFLPHREQPLWKPHFRGSRREGRLWAKRTALCFSEGSPLQAAVSQINSSVCKSEKKKKSRVSECARPAGALPQAFQRLVVHFFSLAACQVPHRQVVACHHVPLGAKQQGFEDEAPRVKQGRLLLPDPNSLQEHFLLREPGSGIGERMGGAS